MEKPNHLVVQLPSIVEPLDLNTLFPQTQPLEIELGCGDASFLVEYARRNPAKNFLGVERLLGRIEKLHRKGSQLGLKNLRGVRIESAYLLQYLIPPHAAAALHIYFPDPWPKRHHHKRRIVQPEFLQLIHDKLKPGGYIHIATDWVPYAQWIETIFAASPLFTGGAIERPEWRPLTKFEGQGIDKGHVVTDLKYFKRD